MIVLIIRNAETGEETRGDWTKSEAIAKANEMAKETKQIHDVLIITPLHHAVPTTFSSTFKF